MAIPRGAADCRIDDAYDLWPGRAARRLVNLDGRDPVGLGPRTSPLVSGDRLNRNLEELDRGSALRSPGAHRIERLVAPAHGLLAVEQRHAEPLDGLAI